MQWSNLPKASLCFYQQPVCRFPTSSTKPTRKAVVSVVQSLLPVGQRSTLKFFIAWPPRLPSWKRLVQFFRHDEALDFHSSWNRTFALRNSDMLEMWFTFCCPHLPSNDHGSTAPVETISFMIQVYDSCVVLLECLYFSFERFKLQVLIFSLKAICSRGTFVECYYESQPDKLASCCLRT